jgi:hypothetical protein
MSRETKDWCSAILPTPAAPGGLSFRFITRTDRDNELKGLADGIRHQFKMQPKQLMHFANLKHEQRVCLTQHIAQSWLTTSSVLVHKEQVQRRDIFQGGAFRLYFYGPTLLERISWFCRDNAPKGDSPECRLIFEHRTNLSYL